MLEKEVVIDLSALFDTNAKLVDLDKYEHSVVTQVGTGENVVITGAALTFIPGS